MKAEYSDVHIEAKAVELYDYVMRFAKQNYKYSEIKQFLMDDGLDEGTAKAVISKVLVLEKQKAKKEMKEGAIVAIFGIVVAALGFILPIKDSWSLLREILLGPVVIGAIMFFKGYSKYS
jgi:hypothetical protein